MSKRCDLVRDIPQKGQHEQEGELSHLFPLVAVVSPYTAAQQHGADSSMATARSCHPTFLQSFTRPSAITQRGQFSSMPDVTVCLHVPSLTVLPTVVHTCICES